MKKFAVLFMILLYGATGTGFAMNLHFCGGTVAAIKINGPAPVCSPDGEKMKGCTDKKVTVKVKDAHQAEVSSKAPGISSFELLGFSLSDFMPAAHQALLEKLFDKTPPPAPPPPSKTEPFLKNRNLRI
ncbi:hypothetical protein ACFQZS_18910 [Mucilaginibacter calamicampi]|uniref:Uncharacterized protein n=1 Tax=Mucilaginibacter calamicampi TaxID=1302352 RepID=A0ABW2Z3A9_9SPHI